jgi:hypothetical protein
VPAKPPKALTPEDPGIAYEVETGPATPAGRCRACGHALPAGGVLCVRCGFNQKTGRKASTAVVTGDDDEGDSATAGAATAKAPPERALPPPPVEPDLSNRFGGIVPGLRAPVFQEEKSKVRPILRPLLLAAAVLVVCGAAVFGFRALGGRKAHVHPVDQDVAELMSQGGARELKEWLADNEPRQRMVSGMSEGQAAAFADKLYRMGAVKVLAFGHLMTGSIGIELPQDPAKRAELFKFQAEWHAGMRVEPQADQGQRYILLKMKL